MESERLPLPECQASRLVRGARGREGAPGAQPRPLVSQVVVGCDKGNHGCHHSYLLHRLVCFLPLDGERKQEC